MAFRPSSVEIQIFVCGNALIGTKEHESNFVDGKWLFQRNCASCHHPVKDATGPALADITSFRTQEWIFRFLTKPAFIPDDKRAINLRKEYDESCRKFPQLRREEVKSVVKYIEYYKR